MDGAANWAQLYDLPDFAYLMRSDDIYGCAGMDWFNDRYNVLLDITKTHNSGFEARLMGSMYTASALLRSRVLNTQPDFFVSERCYEISWERDDPIPDLGGKVLLYDARDGFAPPLSPAAWVIDDKTTCYPLTRTVEGPVKILECFAGGHGGWSMATKVLSDFTDTPFQVVAIEHDPIAASSFAATHETMLIKGYHRDVPKWLKQGESITLCTDILDSSWYEAVGRWGPELCLISAPCQEWSRASTQTGLHGMLGMLLPRTISICRRFRPRILGLEQVLAFQTHPHFPLVIQYLTGSGYDVTWQKIVPSERYGCFTRPRWLCRTQGHQLIASISV